MYSKQQFSTSHHHHVIQFLLKIYKITIFAFYPQVTGKHFIDVNQLLLYYVGVPYKWILLMTNRFINCENSKLITNP